MKIQINFVFYWFCTILLCIYQQISATQLNHGTHTKSNDDISSSMNGLVNSMQRNDTANSLNHISMLNSSNLPYPRQLTLYQSTNSIEFLCSTLSSSDEQHTLAYDFPNADQQCDMPCLFLTIDSTDGTAHMFRPDYPPPSCHPSLQHLNINSPFCTRGTNGIRCSFDACETVVLGSRFSSNKQCNSSCSSTTNGLKILISSMMLQWPADLSIANKYHSNDPYYGQTPPFLCIQTHTISPCPSCSTSMYKNLIQLYNPIPSSYDSYAPPSTSYAIQSQHPIWTDPAVISPSIFILTIGSIIPLLVYSYNIFISTIHRYQRMNEIRSTQRSTSSDTITETRSDVYRQTIYSDTMITTFAQNTRTGWVTDFDQQLAYEHDHFDAQNTSKNEQIHTEKSNDIPNDIQTNPISQSTYVNARNVRMNQVKQSFNSPLHVTHDTTNVQLDVEYDMTSDPAHVTSSMTSHLNNTSSSGSHTVTSSMGSHSSNGTILQRDIPTLSTLSHGHSISKQDHSIGTRSRNDHTKHSVDHTQQTKINTSSISSSSSAAAAALIHLTDSDCDTQSTTLQIGVPTANISDNTSPNSHNTRVSTHIQSLSKLSTYYGLVYHTNATLLNSPNSPNDTLSPIPNALNLNEDNETFLETQSDPYIVSTKQQDNTRHVQSRSNRQENTIQVESRSKRNARNFFSKNTKSMLYKSATYRTNQTNSGQHSNVDTTSTTETTNMHPPLSQRNNQRNNQKSMIPLPNGNTSNKFRNDNSRTTTRDSPSKRPTVPKLHVESLRSFPKENNVPLQQQETTESTIHFNTTEMEEKERNWQSFQLLRGLQGEIEDAETAVRKHLQHLAEDQTANFETVDDTSMGQSLVVSSTETGETSEGQSLYGSNPVAGVSSTGQSLVGSNVVTGVSSTPQSLIESNSKTVCSTDNTNDSNGNNRSTRNMTQQSLPDPTESYETRNDHLMPLQKIQNVCETQQNQMTTEKSKLNDRPNSASFVSRYGSEHLLSPLEGLREVSTPSEYNLKEVCNVRFEFPDEINSETTTTTSTTTRVLNEEVQSRSAYPATITTSTTTTSTTCRMMMKEEASSILSHGSKDSTSNVDRKATDQIRKIHSQTMISTKLNKDSSLPQTNPTLVTDKISNESNQLHTLNTSFYNHPVSTEYRHDLTQLDQFDSDYINGKTQLDEFDSDHVSNHTRKRSHSDSDKLQQYPIESLSKQTLKITKSGRSTTSLRLDPDDIQQSSNKYQMGRAITARSNNSDKKFYKRINSRNSIASGSTELYTPVFRGLIPELSLSSRSTTSLTTLSLSTRLGTDRTYRGLSSRQLNRTESLSPRNPQP